MSRPPNDPRKRSCRPSESRWPLVAGVVRGSYHDGPGLRTVVFLKGCGLRCRFCHSPETQDPRPTLAFHPARCIGCGACVRACSTGARPRPDRLDRARCAQCFACAAACPPGALRRVGEHVPPSALAARIARDRPFYEASGGGVTFSGGEPLLYPRYLLAVLEALNPRGRPPVHVAVQTGGHFAFGLARTVLARVDLVYYDLKVAEEAAHRARLGRSGRRVRANLARLASMEGPRVIVRVPVVPGVTDSEANLRGVLTLARDAGIREVIPLPYNPAGLDRYRAIGRRAPSLPARFQTPSEWAAVQAQFERLRRQIYGRPEEGPEPSEGS